MFLTIGKNGSGQWVSVDEVSSGKTDLFCPFCSVALIAKKGKIKQHHFAHAGDTCNQSIEAAKHSQIPTIDTFELLDPDERKYLERRSRYPHREIFRWTGMQEAIKRLEAMNLIEIHERQSPELAAVKRNLEALGDDYLDKHGQPTPKLKRLLQALSPITDIEINWNKKEGIESTTISRDYLRNSLKHQSSLSGLESAQRYWLDAFYRRQSFAYPEHVAYLTEKIKAYNSQSLYLMAFSGDFAGAEMSFIKIGMTSREPGERLQEVITSLKPHGHNIKGEVVLSVPHLGRLEKLLHHRYEHLSVAIGSFREFFKSSVKDSLADSLAGLMNVGPYHLPVIQITKPHEQNSIRSSASGRKKKTIPELLAEYPDIVALLNEGKGIRPISKLTGRSVNTVQKVQLALNTSKSAQQNSY